MDEMALLRATQLVLKGILSEARESERATVNVAIDEARAIVEKHGDAAKVGVIMVALDYMIEAKGA